LWPQLPCLLHQAVAFSEERLPGLQDCCHQDLNNSRIRLLCTWLEAEKYACCVLYSPSHALLYKHNIHSFAFPEKCYIEGQLLSNMWFHSFDIGDAKRFCRSKSVVFCSVDTPSCLRFDWKSSWFKILGYLQVFFLKIHIA
jgi:hypothetical protein